MALKRLVTEKVADEKLYEKLRRDLDLLPSNHADIKTAKATLKATKVRMVARAR
jgi:hypothetical protein